MVDASNEPECARLDTLFHWMTQYVFVTESDKQACQQAVERVAKQTNERIIQHQLQFQQQMGATPEQQRMMEQILRQQQPVGEAIKNGRVCGGGCKGTCN